MARHLKQRGRVRRSRALSQEVAAAEVLVDKPSDVVDVICRRLTDTTGHHVEYAP